MSPETPFLQIVHVSDLHVVAPEFSWPRLRMLRRVARRLRSVWPELEAKLCEGMAGHHPNAPFMFQRFLRRITSDHPSWRDKTTWIVDTGDLSTFGDEASLRLGIKYLRMFTDTVNDALAIHGNHDVWPGAMPPFSQLTPEQQQSVVDELFPRTYVPLRIAIPGFGQLHLFRLNTVVADMAKNVRAIGKVMDDELDQLARDVAEAARGVSEPIFRILLTHHPIVYPESPTQKPPRFAMILSNAGSVAERLATGTDETNGPLAHLVLSGHAHQLFPAHGALPATVRELYQYPLSDDQCQFLAGSLFQVRPRIAPSETVRVSEESTGASDRPCQCEVLRFSARATRGTPRTMRIERLLAALPAERSIDGEWIARPGEYQFIGINGADSPVERLEVMFD